MIFLCLFLLCLDNIDLLIRSGVLAAVQSVVNYIDGIWEGEVEKDSACSVAVIVDETRHQATSIRNLSGPEMAKLMKLGTRVEAGADWKWGDQVTLSNDSLPN